MKAENILNKVSNTYGGTIPQNALEIVEAMLVAKNLGNKTFDQMEENYNVSSGFYFAVKAEITETRKANNYVSNPAEARADRVLRITNSNGRKVARKF